MEYHARVCFLTAVFTSGCVFNPSRSKYNRQETHAVIIFYICIYISFSLCKNFMKLHKYIRNIGK